jgi:chromosome partitioning protein
MNVLGPDSGLPRQAYVIVCGNEKGGSGKTTTAMHLVVSLLNAGHKVASIDLDSRQMSLSRYVQNRIASVRRHGLRLPIPDHFRLQSSTGDLVSENENAELDAFQRILAQVENTHDFIIIDTPGHDSYAMRLAHSMADTLVTPINDSYVDFDVLGHVDPATGEVINISHYASMVREARRQRRTVDNGLMDWVVVRNRLAQVTSRNNKNVADSLANLAMRLGCRLADGISERVIFRELFPMGFTALDELPPQMQGGGLTLSHLSARQEVRALVATLKLPIDDVGRRRAQARRAWIDSSSRPLEGLDLFAE